MKAALDRGLGWSCTDLAQRLSVKPRDIELAALHGELPCIWFGDVPVFEESEIERWLDNQSYRYQSHVNLENAVPLLEKQLPAQRFDGRWSVKLECPDGVERRFVSTKREPIQPEHRRLPKRNALSVSTRWTVLYRDDFTCRYCGRKAPDVALDLDHVVSVVDGGGDDASNLVVACRDCNAGKGRRSIRSGGEEET